MAAERIRSTILDPAAVRLAAQNYGLHTKLKFIQAFDASKQSGECNASAPEHAWTGVKLGITQAQSIAEFLGLVSYAELEWHKSPAQWEQLINDVVYRQPLFDMVFKPLDPGRGIDFDQVYDLNHLDLDQIHIDNRWHLKLYGKVGYKFAIFLQSTQTVTQLAPLLVNKAGYEASFPKKTDRLMYPTNPDFGFDCSEPLGWRQLIVIQAQHIPLQPRSKNTGHQLSQIELEQFVARLLSLNKEIRIDKKEFMLIGSDKTNK